MNFFKRLFGSKNDDESAENTAGQSPYLPAPSLPIDEQFTFNFKKNGGKFLYCEDMHEIYEHFENIMLENDWYETEVLCFNPELFPILEHNNFNFQNIKKPTFVFSTCESLIADEGSILFSSNQFKALKINELPDNMIVFATTSQLKPQKREGMSEINRKYHPNFPSNITTLRNFEVNSQAHANSLQYSTAPKNLYLLLLEDL
ncbi:lactate utilization protein [Flavobacterium agricola]|uniref:Lactate utilization protein n=1 Tax=Flavobacterium agricola TaxID=2870839 RepID=A0ABY6M0Q2_9FLAO|nr:lactate utilization protein [Flavobacterium agricola]UYW01832.1 lactate utilization protein [Flavobacterium agricola]